MGAPQGNTNALKHGLRCSEVRFSLTLMPAGLKCVEREVNEFRRLIEAAVVAAHGSISVLHAAIIQTACRHEYHARLATKWFRDHQANIKRLDKKLVLTKAIADASTARDKCLDRLRLDVKAADISDMLFGPGNALDNEPIEPTDPEAEPTTETAADGRTEDKEANHADGPRDEDRA